jgi:amino acid transporter
MVGQVAVTAGINAAAAIYLIGAATRALGLPPDAPVPLFGAVTNWYFQIAVMAAIMAPQLTINLRGIRLTSRLNDFSVVWHLVGGAVIVLLLLFLGRHHNPLEFLFRAETAVNPLDAASAEIGGRSVPALVVGDWRFPSPLFAIAPWLADLYRAAPLALVGGLALLQAQWTYTGYDASAHVAEETVMARKNSAWGIFLSVAVSAVAGYVLLLAVTARIPHGDVAATAADPYPVLYVVYENLSQGLGHLVALIIGVAMWLCGLASISSMGRMWYAFARDDGLPGSALLKRVDPHTHVPAAAILVSSGLAVALCLYAAAFTVVTSISTIALYLAYIIPVYLNWRNTRSGKGERVTAATAAWSMGRWAGVVRPAAMLYTGVIVVLFMLPPNELVLWSTLGLAVALALYWVLHARDRFTGPTPADEAALRGIESAEEG